MNTTCSYKNDTVAPSADVHHRRLAIMPSADFALFESPASFQDYVYLTERQLNDSAWNELLDACLAWHSTLIMRIHASDYDMSGVIRQLRRFEHRIGRVIIVGDPHAPGNRTVKEHRISATGATIIILTNEFFSNAVSRPGYSQLDIALDRYADCVPTGVEPDDLAAYLDGTGLETIFDEVVLIEPADLLAQLSTMEPNAIDIDAIVRFIFTSYNTRKA